MCFTVLAQKKMESTVKSFLQYLFGNGTARRTFQNFWMTILFFFPNRGHKVSDIKLRVEMEVIQLIKGSYLKGKETGV